MKTLITFLITLTSTVILNAKPQILGKDYLVIPITHPLSLRQIVNQTVLLVDDHDILTFTDVEVLSQSSCQIDNPVIGPCTLHIVVIDKQGLVSEPFLIDIEYIESRTPILYAPAELWLPNHVGFTDDLLDYFVSFDTNALVLTIEKNPTREDISAVIAVTSASRESYYQQMKVHPISPEYDVALAFDGETLFILADEHFRLTHLQLLSFFRLIDPNITTIEYSLECKKEPSDSRIICGEFIVNHERSYQVAITKQRSIVIDVTTWSEFWDDVYTECSHMLEAIYNFIKRIF